MTQLYTVKEAVQSEQVQEQRPSSKSDQGTVVPVDLDAASRQTDVALPEQPVRIQSDRLLSRNSDGYIIGRGNVDVQQGMEEIHTNQIEGNTKSQVYHTKGPSVYLTSTMALEGDTMTYQAGKQSATLDEVSGFIDSAHYVRGTGAQMYDGMLYLKHGLITTPHAVAKTPDYYLTGDDIRIYPGENLLLKTRNSGSNMFVSLRMAIMKDGWIKPNNGHGYLHFCHGRHTTTITASVFMATDSLHCHKMAIPT